MSLGRVCLLLLAGLGIACRGDSLSVTRSEVSAPPLVSTPPWVGCPPLVGGDYFWRGGAGTYPEWVGHVRVFYRSHVGVVPCIPTEGSRCVAVRWVVGHRYGGCGALDEACYEEALARMRALGVRLIEVYNEMDINCGTCLAVHERVARRARAEGFVVWWNVEPYPPANRQDVWPFYRKLLREGLADFVGVHALLPREVSEIPDDLWSSGALEVSTDGQHCDDLECAHVDTTELLRAVVERLSRTPGVSVYFEVDIFDDGHVESSEWTGREYLELLAYVNKGCPTWP